MKLMTVVALMAALLVHHLSLTDADHTRELNLAGSAGFSLPLVANHRAPEHFVRRGHDDFLYLQSSLSTLVANLTSVHPQDDFGPYAAVHLGTGRGRVWLGLRISTTSSLTWVQCKPCAPMARQKHPLFNPAASPTYKAIKSNSPKCRPPYKPESGLCAFELIGEGGMWVKGHLSTDNVKISTKVSSKVEPEYTFGCSHFTSNFRTDQGVDAGVLALSSAPTSFAMQVAARGLTNFSYCPSQETSRQGFLRFGADVPHNPAYRSTSILPAHDAAYYVGLVGISLGDRRLHGVRSEMFTRRKDGQGGCIVDIGTPFTVMVEEAYRVIEDAMWADLEAHGAKRVDQAGYGLCVQATEEIKGHLQPLSLHFTEEEAMLVVSPKQLFLMVEDKRAGQLACLAIVQGHRTVIGALQQVDTRFVYDLKDKKLSFAPESCIQDTVPVV